MLKISLSLFVYGLLLSFSAEAFQIPASVQEQFLRKGGSKRALAHISCFLKNYGDETFVLNKNTSLNRCKEIENRNPLVSINNQRYIVVVDYTQDSNKRRFFLINLNGNNHRAVQTFYVSHGRYGNTNRSNRKLITRGKYKKNSITKVVHFSNQNGSNASSTGFYITGMRYKGRYDGPGRDNSKYSLVLHGIEHSVNDNACDRAIVVHGNSRISESAGVNTMSSGCFMLDYKYVNPIIDHIKGSYSAGGALFFSYGPREKKLADNFYCSADAGKLLKTK